MKLDFLVTGTGRCGTVYMARLLTSLGITCGHEAIFDYEGIDKAKAIINGEFEPQTSYCSITNLLNGKEIDKWYDPSKTRAESSYMAAPFLQHELLKDTKIIHVVRDPLKVLSSHIFDVRFFDKNLDDPIQKHYQNFVFSILPELNVIDNEIERGCYYYTQWNKMIEENHQGKYLLHKVENGCTKELLNFLEVTNHSQIFTNKKINSWKKDREDLTLNQIPDGSIKKEFLKMSTKHQYLPVKVI